jgi:hypothetical protein
MGKLTNLNPSKALTEADMPPGMATDNEVTVALNAHVNAANPHPIYLTQAEADAMYRQSSVAYFVTAPLPTANIAGNSIGFGWNSVQSGQGIAELVNYAGLGGGDAFNFFRMPGNAIAAPSLSNRVSRIDISGGYVQTSDARLKTDFCIAPGLDILTKLSPVQYNHWSCDGFDRENGKLKLGKFSTTKIGFVAQEVQKVLPQAVSVPSSEEELWGIDYNCILACAVQAIRDLKLEVDQLKKEVVELRSQVPA